MIRIVSPRYVTIADQCLPPITPMNKNRGSVSERLAARSRLSSSQSACASTKSMPCLALLAQLLASSKSNVY
jgi:hypothetical protein